MISCDPRQRFVRELGDETAKRLRTAGLKARQLVLHVMTRHPDAPIDTPKFLGHGHVNQENRTSTLSGANGGATDDGGTVGEVAWRLMASMNAPPHELRGIGIQLTKLEKDGLSVETVHERGQSKLSFRPRGIGNASDLSGPQPSVARPSTSENQRKAASDAQQSAVSGHDGKSTSSKSPLTLVLTSDSSEDEAVVAPARAEVRTRLRSRSVQSNARAAEPYIPSMFRPTKRSAKVPTKSPSQVTTEELRYYDIDPEAYRTFDRALQVEILNEARRRKPPLRKLKTARMVEIAPPARPKTNAPEVIVLPPSPAEATDSQIVAMEYDPVIFRELGKATQLEQIALHHARQARTVAGDRTLSSRGKKDAHLGKASSRNRPPVKAVSVRPAPRFQGQTDRLEILNRVEMWMETAAEQPPDREDIDALGRYIEKCASRERGHDLAQAADILRWWDCLLRQTFPADTQADPTADLWRLGYRQVCERLERVVQKATGRRLNL
jgi:DNA repair protein REV1